MHGKNRSRHRPWYIRPGDFFYRKLPAGTKKRLHTMVEKYIRWKPDRDRRQTEEEQVHDRCRSFITEELSVLFWGILILLMLLPFCICLAILPPREVRLARNSFGKGDREEELVLQGKKGNRSVSVTVGEQEPSEKEIESLYESLFKEIKKVMRGKNPSLQAVSLPLGFEENLDGYPFEIDYEPEDLSLIDLAGKPGEDAEKLKAGEEKRTRVRVTASYKSLEKSRVFPVTLVAAGNRDPTVYDKVLARLSRIERTGRKKEEVVFPGKVEEVNIRLPGTGERYYALIILALALPVVLMYHRYYRLKELDQKKRKEEEEDFPLIIHLLTLYMRAGLSYGSAIHRIMQHDAASGGRGERYAFLELAFVDRQLSMGVSQKEACINWGKRSRNLMYQRLSAALIQILVKGSKEGDRIMERMEHEAFEQRIDRARKEGKTAETRLLFPMMVLLMLAMLLVLFPAAARFRGF